MALKRIAPQATRKTVGQAEAPPEGSVTTAKLLRGRVRFIGTFEFPVGIDIVLEDAIEKNAVLKTKFPTAEKLADALEKMTYITTDDEEDFEKPYFLVNRGVERPQVEEDEQVRKPRRLSRVA